MCGRYTVLTEDEIIQIREILKNLSMRIVKDDFLNYDELSSGINSTSEVYPTNNPPVILQNDDGISFERVKWGFKKWDGKGVIINARCETIKIKGMFAKHIDAGRCVVPAGEFFEWDKVDGGKRKHFIKDKSGNILFMAGLYRDTDEGREFVIITKKATEKMAQLHDRMPVILRVDQLESWLSGELTPEELDKLDFDVEINPCDVDKMEQLNLFD